MCNICNSMKISNTYISLTAMVSFVLLLTSMTCGVQQDMAVVSQLLQWDGITELQSDTGTDCLVS